MGILAQAQPSPKSEAGCQCHVGHGRRAGWMHGMNLQCLHGVVLACKEAVSDRILCSCLQITLGISTLLYFVPTPLAATHQAGSLALLTFATWFMYELRKIPK
eukprot:TRINITY_DN8137_c0_g1_i3.p3 TRINITY_DN8137_c0_g1~~TRINITY_DN8137_c0_g1_i3.p3  ORF type:complete len:103 (+),score=13.52 TRINITY_DN8137_c0_g1_i3:1225-1533(+)